MGKPRGKVATSLKVREKAPDSNFVISRLREPSVKVPSDQFRREKRAWSTAEVAWLSIQNSEKVPIFALKTTQREAADAKKF